MRLLEESDADAVFAVVEANLAYLAPWMPWAHEPRRSATLEFIRLGRRQLVDNDGFQAAIVEDGRIIGAIGFHAVSWKHRSASIGYWLAEDRQGRGIMTAAVRALVDHAFTAWDLHRVEIRAAPGNGRSRAIPERLGFREEGVLRGAERFHDRYVDLVVYAVLAPEWAERSGLPSS